MKKSTTRSIKFRVIDKGRVSLWSHLITVWPLIGGQVAQAFSRSELSHLFKSCQVLSFRSDIRSITDQ